jgi:hypothetical protein
MTLSPRMAILLSAGILALGACAPLDTDGLEAQIEQSIARQAGGFKVEVDCPDDVKAEKGNNFECTVVAENGSRATIRVIQEDGEGDVRWEITEDITD